MLLAQFPIVDVMAVMSVLEAANAVLCELRRDALYEVRLAGWSGPSVTSSSGIPLAVRRAPARLRPAATRMVIAGGPPVPGRESVRERGDALAWLQRQRAQWPRTYTIGREAAALVGQAVWLDQGAGASVPWSDWRETGVTRGAEMALSLVMEDLGGAIASTVAHRLAAPYERLPDDGRVPGAFAERAWGDARVVDLHRWIGGHLRQHITVAVLAEQLSMSERTFARFYRRATGLTPAAAVLRIRLDAATRLLAGADNPVKQVAVQCGFSSAEVMRRAFLRHFRMAPSQYRALHVQGMR
ncbi:MAG: helix-turn-helix domain-containing protein [Pseudomonadota bacterium]|nr:helix-turn-helix domain-containing protein [Pseudomonadota bacterium]